MNNRPTITTSGAMSVADAYDGIMQDIYYNNILFKLNYMGMVVTGIEKCQQGGWYLLHNPEHPDGVPTRGTRMIWYEPPTWEVTP